jgi:ketosteroid isomerase-like protein
MNARYVITMADSDRAHLASMKGRRERRGKPMPSPLETVEALYSAAARGDFEAFMGLLDTDVEWLTPKTLPWSRGDYHGRDDVGEYLASISEAADDVRVEPDELLTCGEHVVALGVYSGRSRLTGRDFSARFAHVLTIREGRVVAMRGLEDTAAIAAAFE